MKKKICPNCGTVLKENASFCQNCGARFIRVASEQQNGYAPPPPSGGYTPPQGDYTPPQGGYAPPPPPTHDHTAEFDPKDISDNKVLAIAAYLLGWIGVIFALIAGKDSPYAAFHARQALKILVLEMLTLFLGIFFIWTFIAPLAAAVFIFILFVVNIIAFFDVCGGKAKEPPIVRSFGFLK